MTYRGRYDLRDPRGRRQMSPQEAAQQARRITSDLAGNEISYDNGTSGLTATTLQGALDEVVSADPAYTVTNDATDRTLDSDAAAGAISDPPTQAEVEGLRDALLSLSDVVATLVADLQHKKVIG